MRNGICILMVVCKSRNSMTARSSTHRPKNTFPSNIDRTIRFEFLFEYPCNWKWFELSRIWTMKPSCHESSLFLVKEAQCKGACEASSFSTVQMPNTCYSWLSDVYLLPLNTYFFHFQSFLCHLCCFVDGMELVCLRVPKISEYGFTLPKTCIWCRHWKVFEPFMYASREMENQMSP